MGASSSPPKFWTAQRWRPPGDDVHTRAPHYPFRANRARRCNDELAIMKTEVHLKGVEI